MATTQNADDAGCWRGCGGTGAPVLRRWRAARHSPLGGPSAGFLQNQTLNPSMQQSPSPVLTQVGWNPARPGLQRLCSSLPRLRSNQDVLRWMDKLRLIQTTECYSTLKRNELSRHKKTRRNLKCILLSKKSQSGKFPNCTIPMLWRSGKGKMWRPSKDQRLPGVGRRRGWTAGHGGLLGQWKYSLSDTVMVSVLLDTCPNP